MGAFADFADAHSGCQAENDRVQCVPTISEDRIFRSYARNKMAALRTLSSDLPVVVLEYFEIQLR